MNCFAIDLGSSMMVEQSEAKIACRSDSATIFQHCASNPLSTMVIVRQYGLSMLLLKYDEYSFRSACTSGYRRLQDCVARLSVMSCSPLQYVATSPSRFTSHSPWKPGRRVWPVRSCCMAACLRSRFLAMSRSSPPSSASTSLNAAAMARCSATVAERQSSICEQIVLDALSADRQHSTCAYASRDYRASVRNREAVMLEIVSAFGRVDTGMI